jgi:beta-mannosidase
VRWSLESLEGEALSSGRIPIQVDPQASTQVCELDFSDRITEDNLRKLVFVAELWQRDQLISRQTAYFAPIKHLSLTDPAIAVNLQSQDGELIIELVSRSLALLVEVSLAGADAVFSDNYFNLPPGRPTRISCPMPAGWTLSKAKREIRVRSIYDSYSRRAI